MKAVLVRAVSLPILPGSPRVSLSVVRDSVAGAVFSADKTNVVAAPKMSLHLQMNGAKKDVPRGGIRRAFSESDVLHSESTDVSRRFSALNDGSGSRSFSARIPEVEEEDYDYSLSVGNVVDVAANYAGIWPDSRIPVEELGFTGGGIGNGKITGGGGGGDGAGDTSTGGYEDRRKIGAYYKEMLKSNPGDPLLLRNYGKFLHEVYIYSLCLQFSYQFHLVNIYIYMYVFCC